MKRTTELKWYKTKDFTDAQARRVFDLKGFVYPDVQRELKKFAETMVVVGICETIRDSNFLTPEIKGPRLFIGDSTGVAIQFEWDAFFEYLLGHSEEDRDKVIAAVDKALNKIRES